MFWLMGLALFGFVFMALAFVVNLVAAVWALVTIASSRKDAGYKLIWAVLVLILGIIGALLYYLLEYPKAGRGRTNERGRR